MDYVIEPSPLSGTIDAIASKSAAHRLLILAALADTTCDIDCPTTSRDIEATIACLEGLGARVARTRSGFRVRPIASAPAPNSDAAPILDCGESGSTLRFMLPVVCALGRPARLMGHGRLAERPLSPLYEQLVEHGARLSPAGALPLSVEGTLAGGTFELPGNVSSQYVSGLLMAAAALRDDVEVLVSEPVESRSYIDMTVSALEAFGVGVRVRTVERRRRLLRRCSRWSGRRSARPGPISVEGDWSNAAFWLCSGAIARSVGVRGLDGQSAQGDRACLAALAAFGARASRTEGDSATPGAPPSRPHDRGLEHPRPRPATRRRGRPRRGHHAHHRRRPPASQGVGPPRDRTRGARRDGRRHRGRRRRPHHTRAAARSPEASSTPRTTTASP